MPSKGLVADLKGPSDVLENVSSRFYNWKGKLHRVPGASGICDLSSSSSGEEPMNTIQIRPIGVVHSPFKEPKGTPIQPAMAEGAAGTVRVFKKYQDGLKDVEGFDRIWLVYWFHRSQRARLLVTRFLDDGERGVFATRAPAWPNPIAISSVRLLRVEGNVLKAADVDILDGTPLLDIKPYAPAFESYRVKRCGWLDKARKSRRVADERFERGDGK
jgi:tRNA-Thr(GGU) m(6)t(6)A37 methyltransferase TsaA